MVTSSGTEVFGKRAEECLALAAKATSATEKKSWLRLAESWRELEEHALRNGPS